jgi:hypothetical protein
MSVLFLADPHLGTSNHNKEVFKAHLEFFEQQLFPYVLQNKIKNVVICGDFYDNRNVVDIFILQETKERFFKWFADNNVSLHLTVGNHCTYFKDTNKYNIYTAAGIDKLTNIYVYHDVTNVIIDRKIFSFVPWQVENKPVILNKEVDVVVGHFPAIGFPMTKGIDCKDGIDISSFKEYPLVVSGHFHIQKRIGNFQMLGNPYQKDWGDFGESKGFWVFENDKLTLIENEVSPKHIKIFYKEDGDRVVLETKGLGINDVWCVSDDKKLYSYLLKLCEKNHIRFILLSKARQKKIDKIYNDILNASLGLNKIEMVDAVDVIESCDFSSMENEIKEDSDVVGNMQLYTDSVTLNPSLDKDKLSLLFGEIYKEAVLMEKGI